ncbi:MAG: DUF4124 domain-containing protein [Gammaproteobacteria bacterium]|nr:DUF4124 domain-containing protein [Gammaproteobacteria bacterium]
MKKIILFLLLIYPYSLQAAAVYESVDNNGNTIYSDSPSPNAKQLEITPTQTAQPIINNVQPKEKKSVEIIAHEKNKPYTKFSLTAPHDEDTFQNQRDIPVEVSIEPKLQKGDKVQLLLDGHPNGDAVESTTLHLLQPERGSHTVSVALLDENQKVLMQTNSITIFVMYAHIGSGAPTTG